ncbi:hypothetical protein WBN73_05510 [Paenarthrobacter sp. CCNWLY172]|uniref:hypothetical protein n=1 Tax=unclassified Paenarthrobacter TaxID=2634190 RepID=UPI003076D2CD
MSVMVLFGNGGEAEFVDKGSVEYHYLLSAAGVLSVVENDNDTWRVVTEYSPAGWVNVNGTRRTVPLAGLPGSDGKKLEGAPRGARFQQN